MSEVWFDAFQASALWIGAGCSVMCAAGLRFWVTVTLRFYVARHGRLPSRWFVGLCFAWAVMTWPKTFWALARVR